MNQFLKRLFLVMAVAAMGCTKEAPMESAPKDEQLTTKALVDTKGTYIYVASNAEASRTSPAARPFWFGSEKLVKLEFTKNSLQVLEIEKDGRFDDNPTNSKVLLEIPVTHVDYQCAKDRFGECTNKEEENADLSWKDRAYFIPKINDLSVSELSLLPVELDNYFGSQCYTETAHKLVDYSFTPEAINIAIEKSFRVEVKCLGDNIESLSDLNFSSVYHYSIVRTDQLTSSNYQPIEYPDYDERAFGFFTTELHNLSSDNRDDETNKIVYMNRWKPHRGTISYLLSDNFYKPENSAVLKATQESVEHINTALSSAQSGIQISLEKANGRQAGDIRNNMIVLVEDPLAQNVIGYGPSVANPLTGEIVSAKTIMYLGTVKKFIRRTYEEFVAREKGRSDPMTLPELTEGMKLPVSFQQTVGGQLLNQHTKVANPIANMVKTVADKSSNSSRRPSPVKLNMAKAKSELHDYTARKAGSERLQDQIEALSEHCAYPAELVNFESGVAEAIKKVLNNKLDPWESLSDNQKAAIVDIVVPYVWVPTLVHELGHNLGLRHNFAGSEDKANFYSLDELKEQGVERDSPITYSSVMDYSYSNLNELRSMGKYDIAALQFGYARQVNVEEVKTDTDGKDVVMPVGVQSVATTLKSADAKIGEKGTKEGKTLRRRDYQYCSDEHVSVNAGCNRFDEGTTYTEIATHLWKSYEKDYSYRNFRNGARNFSLFGDKGAVSRLNNTFGSMRVFFEVFERIDQQFQPTEDNYNQIEFLKDLREATDISVSFYINVLKTPDVTCVVAPKNSPEKIVGVLPLHRLSSNAMSCFDQATEQALNPAYIIVAEFGKSFQSKKSPDSENAYADQIDVRGIWMDKALATKYLLSRELNILSFDKYQTNYTQYNRYAGFILEAFVGILTDSLQTQTEIRFKDGQTQVATVPVFLEDTHLIPRNINASVQKVLGLPETDIGIDDYLLRSIQELSPSRVETQNAEAMLDLFQVFRSLSAGDSRSYNSVDVGSRRYLALKENILAGMAIEAIKAHRDLKTLDKKAIEAILTRLKAGEKLPENATEVEKRIYALGADLISSYLSGEMKSEAYYTRLLSLLPVGS